MLIPYLLPDTLLVTKMAKIDTLFMTKTAKTHTLWVTRTYIAHIREYLPPRGWNAMPGGMYDIEYQIKLTGISRRVTLTITIKGLITFQHATHHMDTCRPVVLSIFLANFCAPVAEKKTV